MGLLRAVLVGSFGGREQLLGQSIDYLLRVSISFNGIEYSLDDPFFVDDERNPSGHVGFLVQNSIGLRDALVGIRYQLEWKIELLRKMLMGRDIINAHDQNLGP